MGVCCPLHDCLVPWVDRGAFFLLLLLLLCGHREFIVPVPEGCGRNQSHLSSPPFTLPSSGPSAAFRQHCCGRNQSHLSSPPHGVDANCSTLLISVEFCQVPSVELRQVPPDHLASAGSGCMQTQFSMGMASSVPAHHVDDAALGIIATWLSLMLLAVPAHHVDDYVGVARRVEYLYISICA